MGLALGLSMFTATRLLWAQPTTDNQPAQSPEATTPQAGSSSTTSTASEAVSGGQGQGTGTTDKESAKAPTEPTPLIEVKRTEGEVPRYSIELRNADIADVFRILAHDYNLNILVDNSVKGTVTASLTNVSLEEALEAITAINNLTLKRQGNILRLTQNLVTKTFVLNSAVASDLLGSSGSSSQGSAGTGGASAPAAIGTGGTSTTATTGAGTTGGSTASKTQGTIYDLLSSDGKVFLGQQPNSIMVIDYPENADKVEAFLKVVDQGMARRVFTLRYLDAKDVAGKAQSSTSGSATTSTTGASATTGTSGSSSGSY